MVPQGGLVADVTQQEAACVVAVMAGLLTHCGRHNVYYRATGRALDAMPYYDKHHDELRKFFSSPVAFHVAVAHALSTHRAYTCDRCVWGGQAP